MDIHCLCIKKAIAILAESDMGLVEQFMKELDGYQKIYLFYNQDYEAFKKYNTKNHELVLA